MFNEILDFLNSFLQALLIKRDPTVISLFLHDNVTWFATDSEAQIVGIKDTLESIKNDIDNYEFLFSIEDTNYSVEKIDENNFLATGIMTVKFNKEHGYHDSTKVRITTMINNEPALKLRHVHFSYPVLEQNIYKERKLIKNVSNSEDPISIDGYLRILNETNDVFFEYNIIKSVTNYSKNWALEFGYSPRTDEFAPFVETSFFNKIHAEDRDIALKAFHDILDGARYVGIVIRIYNKDSAYNWYKVRFISIVDNFGIPYKTIGSIVDINIEMEKYELLTKKLDFDSLTGVLNKEAFSNAVENAVSGNQVEKGAVFFVDIDDFKIINDTHGHYYGDYILAEFAKCFKKVFRKSDLVGRVGGDEFMVFVKNITPFMAAKRAKSLLNEVNSIIINETNNHFLMCSIGIAFYPINAQCYAELYKKSDQALYHAKNKGKNHFAIYEGE